MLGFAPLASAPLADDGVEGAVVVNLTGDDSTTGSPTFGASAIDQVHVLAADSITTGQPKEDAAQHLVDCCCNATH
jgi:hypothetical protein